MLNNAEQKNTYELDMLPYLQQYNSNQSKTLNSLKIKVYRHMKRYNNNGKSLIHSLWRHMHFTLQLVQNRKISVVVGV